MLDKTINLNNLNEKFNSWIEQQENLEKAKSTIYGYEVSFKKFVEYLEENNINEINKDSVISYKNFLLKLKDKGFMKLSSINQKIITLNKFFKEAELAELTVKTEREQTSNSNNETITESDYNRLIKWADKLGMQREKLIMRTLAETGIRINELEYFTIENLKEERKNKSISVKNKGKNRKIYIDNDLKRDLLKYAKENKITTGVIFHGRSTDRLLDKAQIWRNLKYIAGQARVKKSKVHSHSFRKLFARRYTRIYGKENILDLADWLGHSSLETTRRYTRGTDIENKTRISFMNKEAKKGKRN